MSMQQSHISSRDFLASLDAHAESPLCLWLDLWVEMPSIGPSFQPNVGRRHKSIVTGKNKFSKGGGWYYTCFFHVYLPLSQMAAFHLSGKVWANRDGSEVSSLENWQDLSGAFDLGWGSPSGPGDQRLWLTGADRAKIEHLKAGWQLCWISISSTARSPHLKIILWSLSGFFLFSSSVKNVKPRGLPVVCKADWKCDCSSLSPSTIQSVSSSHLI